MAPQTISSCLDTLEKFMIQEVTIGSSIVLTKKKEKIKLISTKTAAESVAEILGIENIGKLLFLFKLINAALALVYFERPITWSGTNSNP